MFLAFSFRFAHLRRQPCGLISFYLQFVYLDFSSQLAHLRIQFSQAILNRLQFVPLHQLACFTSDSTLSSLASLFKISRSHLQFALHGCTHSSLASRFCLQLARFTIQVTAFSLHGSAFSSLASRFKSQLAHLTVLRTARSRHGSSQSSLASRF